MFWIRASGLRRERGSAWGSALRCDVLF